MNIKPGDIFCTRNPMWLGRAINFVQKIGSKDNQSEYSHAGIILTADGETFEALWRNGRQNIFEAYKGKKVLVGRHIEMDPEKFGAGWNGIKHHEGKWYAGHRLLLHLIPLASKLSFGMAVCSEIVMKFLCKAGIADTWAGWNPDDVADMIHNYKVYEVVFEGVIE
ncbi:MAG: hypothetical protein M0P37_05200 [Synergistaceae bacterium]|nr:hypothetical protein [Synergistaceae bacterium]